MPYVVALFDNGYSDVIYIYTIGVVCSLVSVALMSRRLCF